MQKVLNKSVVRNGYVMCGQDAPIGLNYDKEPTMDKFNAQMRLCKARITTEDMDILVQQFPKMVEIMRARGTVTELEMDELGIPNVNNLDSDSKAKDARALHKQRAVIMNMDDCISKYKLYQQRNATRSKSTEARKTLTTTKAAEKRRRDNMTPEEKKLEAAAKRKATLAAKKKLQSTVPAETADSRNEEHSFIDENEEETYFSRFITEEFTI
jgi:hypothetical protein